MKAVAVRAENQLASLALGGIMLLPLAEIATRRIIATGIPGAAPPSRPCPGGGCGSHRPGAAPASVIDSLDIERHNAEIHDNLARWQRKPVLRKAYAALYRAVAAMLKRKPRISLALLRSDWGSRSLRASKYPFTVDR